MFFKYFFKSLTELFTVGAVRQIFAEVDYYKGLISRYLETLWVEHRTHFKDVIRSFLTPKILWYITTRIINP